MYKEYADEEEKVSEQVAQLETQLAGLRLKEKTNAKLN
jgi:hypothetical protein